MPPKSNRLTASPPVREKVYRKLRQQLLASRLKPGQRLTEEALAGKLGVSRTPVREALHKLELEGLVEKTGSRGFRVPQASYEDKLELFEIRAVLEGHALASLCTVVTAGDISSLQRLVDEAEQACREGELARVFEVNTSFHDLLYALLAERRPRLYSLIEDMREYVLRYRKDTLVRLDAAKRSLAGHKKILMALELQDRDLCERIMRDHVYEAMHDSGAGDNRPRRKAAERPDRQHDNS